jgi:hypothetical protein
MVAERCGGDEVCSGAGHFVRAEDDARGPHHDLVAVAQRVIPHAGSVDEGAVQRAEVVQHVATLDGVDVAVLLRHDPIQHLVGVVRVASEGVVREQFPVLLTVSSDDGDSGHVSAKGSARAAMVPIEAGGSKAHAIRPQFSCREKSSDPPPSAARTNEKSGPKPLPPEL